MKSLVAALLFCFFTSGANAAVVTWKITGNVVNGGSGAWVADAWGGRVNSGDAFEILISFNAAAPVTGTDADGHGWQYDNAIQSMQITVNGQTRVMTIDGIGGPGGQGDLREIGVTDSRPIGDIDGVDTVLDHYQFRNYDVFESPDEAGADRFEYLAVSWGDRGETAGMLTSGGLLASPDVLMTANYSKRIQWG
ncbi:MAG: hypothetical protein ACR2P6_05035, partial [Gammaproteobacteria bacterium]